MNINFNKFPCYTSIAKTSTVEINIKEILANTMYMRGSGIATGALAMKIYNSDGELDYDNKECEIIKQFSQIINPVFKDSILDFLSKQSENEEK